MIEKAQKLEFSYPNIPKFRYSCDSVLHNFFTPYSIIPVLQYSNQLTEEVERWQD